MREVYPFNIVQFFFFFFCFYINIFQGTKLADMKIFNFKCAKI